METLHWLAALGEVRKRHSSMEQQPSNMLENKIEHRNSVQGEPLAPIYPPQASVGFCYPCTPLSAVSMLSAPC